MLTRRPWLAGCFAVLMAALLLGAVYRLLALRFAAGDVYPPYSSLRPDPLGARALLESLARLPGLTVRRHFDPAPDSLPDGRGTTLLVLGLPAAGLERVPEADFRALERFVREGGRLLLALHGGGPDWHTETEAERERREQRERRRRERGEPDRGELAGRSVALTEQWGFRIASRPLERDEAGTALPVPVTRAAAAPEELPAALSWRSPRVFRSQAEAWTTLYRHGDDAVVMERRLGPGRVVLLADSYPFSNEALWRDRESALVWWALGGGKGMVVFDETHFGLAEQAGVATLARRYGLHGVPLALLVVAALVVWRSAAPLVPRAATGGAAPRPAGRDSAGAFENLLRRSVPPRELAAVCVREWRHGVAAGRPDLAPRAAALEARLEADDGRDFGALWRDLAALASGRVPEKLPAAGRRPPPPLHPP